MATQAMDVEEIRSDNPPPSRVLQQFAVRLCVAFTLTAVFLFIGELGACYGLRRYLDYRSVRMARDNSIYQGLSWAPEYWKEHEAANQSQYEPYILWRHAPYQGELINVDAEGVRKTDYSECDATAYTIWMFGDSSLWGSGVPDWGTLSSALAKRYQESGRKVCVRNFGEIGWVNTQEVLALMLYLKREPHKPNLVIFYDGSADIFASYMGGKVEVHQNFEEFKDTLEGRAAEKRGSLVFLEHTNTANFLEIFADKLGLRGTPATPQRTTQLAREIADNYTENMDTVDALAAKYGFRYMYFLHPTAWTGNKVLTRDETFLLWHEEIVRPGMGALITATYKLFPQDHGNFVRLDHALDSRKETFFTGTTHTSPAANDILADQIFKNLQQRGM
jgi:hypothetical protein